MWRLARDLRIDATEQNLTLISPPGDMAVAPNGTIVISQNQDGLLRFFDSRGGSLGSFGRKGQGPGEFQSIGRFTWLGDTLMIADVSTRRFTMVGPDRKLLRTVPWLAAVSMSRTSGDAAPRFRVSAPRFRYADGSQLVTVALATGSPIPDWPGGAKEGTPILRVDSAGTFQRLVAWFPRRQCTSPYDAGAGMGSGNLSIPFCAQALEEVAPDGRLTLAYVEEGNTAAFHVIAFQANGDTIFSRSYPHRPVAIAQSAKDSARAIRNRGSQSQRDAAERIQIPATYPSVSRLLVGRDGTTWLETYGEGGSRSWSVLDPRGNPIGRTVAPPNTQIMVASGESIWAIETDSDGLQHIVRFRVTR